MTQEQELQYLRDWKAQLEQEKPYDCYWSRRAIKAEKSKQEYLENHCFGSVQWETELKTDNNFINFFDFYVRCADIEYIARVKNESYGSHDIVIGLKSGKELRDKKHNSSPASNARFFEEREQEYQELLKKVTG